MQQSLSSTAQEEISGIENDPIIQSLFEDAIGVLCVAGADENAPAAYPSSEQCEAQLQRRTRGEKTQNQQKTENKTKKQLEIKSKRRKLERIKAPVTIFRKSKHKEVPSEEEQEIAVKRMLSYVSQMPTQEKFLPPPVPFVRILTDESNVKKQIILLRTSQPLQKVFKTTLICQMIKMLLCGRCWSPHPATAMFLLER